MPANSAPNIGPVPIKATGPRPGLFKARTARTARTTRFTAGRVELLRSRPGRPRGGAGGGGEPNAPATLPGGGPAAESSFLGIVDTPLDWTTELGRAFKLIGDFVSGIFEPSWWLRQILTVGGVIAIVGGLIAFMRG